MTIQGTQQLDLYALNTCGLEFTQLIIFRDIPVKVRCHKPDTVHSPCYRHVKPFSQ